MLENNDLLIAHVIREKGGAATCLHMAEKLEKPVRAYKKAAPKDG